MAKTNSGLLEFKDAQKVLIALDDATSEVKKAVIIDADGTETNIAGGGGGDVTVEALSVTENGTYSEEGKAYSPVTVDVAGGSSDFTTAAVTVIQQEASLRGLLLPSISNDTFELQEYQSGIHTVPLYKGSLFIMNAGNLGIIESVSGDIEELGEGKDYYYRIFGDGTITIS